MDVVIPIIIFVAISFLGGIARLCFFGSCSLRQALIFIIIIDIVIGILFAVFKIFVIDEEIQDQILLFTLIPIAAIFIVLETIKSKRKM